MEYRFRYAHPYYMPGVERAYRPGPPVRAIFLLGAVTVACGVMAASFLEQATAGYGAKYARVDPIQTATTARTHRYVLRRSVLTDEPRRICFHVDAAACSN
jgi:hypothetical protein